MRGNFQRLDEPVWSPGEAVTEITRLKADDGGADGVLLTRYETRR